MTRPPPARLPPGANLEHLRKQAKRLRKRCQQRDVHAAARVVQAVARFGRGHERLDHCADVTLAETQLTVAKENGYPSWAAMTRALRARKNSSPLPLRSESETDMPLPFQLNKLNQVWLDCTDLAEADAFYADTLGLTKTGEVPGVMNLYDMSGVQLILGQTDQPRPNSYLYFDVPGKSGVINEAYEALKAAGVKVVEPPHCIAHGWNGRDVWIAFFDDPAGNRLALKSDVPA